MRIGLTCGQHRPTAHSQLPGPKLQPFRPVRTTICRSAQPASEASTATEASRDIKVTASWPSGSKTFTLQSGEEILRKALLAEKVDLYTTWGKVTNCGGGGSCGTCVVEVLEGGELLSERTSAEDKKLKGKPASWRLACQAVCGSGENGGKLSVRTQPK